MDAAGADYLLTVEGFEDLWSALDEDGVLAITRWVLVPPRDVSRLLATARRVLDDERLESARHVALIRGWSTVTLLVSRRPLGTREVAALRAWSESRGFDLVWAPGVSASLANRYNLLEPDWFRAAAEGLLGPEPGRFTWWDYRAGNFHKNLGMRIDHLLVTAPVAARIAWAEIDREARKGPPIPSDHAPLVIDLDERGRPFDPDWEGALARIAARSRPRGG